MISTSTSTDTRIRRCAVCKVDRKGRLTFVDTEAEHLLGASQVELFGRQLSDFLVPDDKDVILEITNRFRHYETRYDAARVTIASTDGQTAPVNLIISQNFAAGNPVNFQIIISPETVGNVLSDKVPVADTSEQFLQYLTSSDVLYDHKGTADQVRAFCNAKTVVLVDTVGPHPDVIAMSTDTTLDPSVADWTADSQAGQQNPITLADGRPCLLVVQSGHSAHSVEDTMVLHRARLAADLLRRLSVPADQPSGEAETTLRTFSLTDSLELLGTSAALIGADGALVDSNPSFKIALGADQPGPDLRAVTARLDACNDRSMTDLVDAYLQAADTHTSAPVLSQIVRTPAGPMARLSIFRLVPGSRDRSCYVILQPATIGAVDAGRRGLGNDFLLQATERLISSSAAAMSGWQKLQHEYHNELSRDGNFYLVCLSNQMARIQTTLQEIRRVVELSAQQEERQTADLGLLVDQLTSELANDFPTATVSVKHAGLPKIDAERRKLTLALRSTLNTIVRRASNGPVEIEVAVQSEDDRPVVRVTNSRPVWSDQDIAKAFDYGRNAVGRALPEAEGFSIDLSVAREIVASMGGHMELTRGSARGAVVALRLPK